MALIPQLVPIKFGQGIDTKVDPKQQLITTFRKARNITYETIGSLKKRNGYDQIQLYTLENEHLIRAQKLTTFKDELNVFSENRLYAYSESVGKLSDKGPIYPVYSQVTPVINAAAGVVSSDVALISGLEIHAYATDANEARYSIKDSANGTFLASNNLLGTGSQVKVVPVNNYAYIFYSSGTNISFRRVAITTPNAPDAAVPLANNLNSTTPVWDVETHQNKIFVSYNSSVLAARLRIVSVLSDGSVGTGIGVSGTPDSHAITVFVDSSAQVNVFFASTTALKILQANFLLTGIVVPETTIDATSNVVNIGALETATGEYDLWYEVSQTADMDHYIKQMQVDSIGAITESPTVFVRSLGLVSKPYYVNALPYVPAVFGSDLQSTAFVLDANANVVAKFSPETSSSVLTSGSLSHTQMLDSETALISGQYTTKIDAENGDLRSVFGVAEVRIQHTESNPIQAAVLGDNLHISGGVMRSYDADEVAEHGFNMYPDSITAGTTSGVGGNIAAGNYGYVAVYRWTDNYGQEHRSSESPNLDVVIAGGPSTHTQQIIVPTLRVTDKTEVVIELYRTEDNGSVFYRTATALNDTTVDSITITDTTADASLIAELPLYTTGGVLANGQAPSARLLSTHTSSNRIFAVAEDDNLLIYSKIREQGKPVEWARELVMPVDAIGGRISALAAMDEKEVIFKETAILFIAGSGPNNLGQQDTFTEPERVAVDVGCTEPSSIVLTPSGLMFKSTKGIYLLTRSLGLQYIGAPVEDYNSLQITSAKLISRNNQVRFTTSDGDCLVYNYLLGLWSTFSNHEALDAVVVGTDYYYIRTDGSVFKENPTSFSDNGTPISIFVETAWISFAGIQAFQRAYKMLVIGDYKSAHMLRVRAAYNFVNAWTHEKILNPVSDIVSGVAYGDSSPYGEESVYGGDGSPYQARFDFAKQKCQAIKLQFQDMQTVAGEGLVLSAMTLEIGIKKGLFKPGQSKIKGVS